MAAKVHKTKHFTLNKLLGVCVHCLSHILQLMGSITQYYQWSRCSEMSTVRPWLSLPLSKSYGNENVQVGEWLNPGDRIYLGQHGVTARCFSPPESERRLRSVRSVRWRRRVCASCRVLFL